MKEIKKYLLTLMLSLSAGMALSQSQLAKPIRLNLSEDGNQYVRFTLLNQTWLRYTDLNPGSALNGYAQNAVFDIGLRRTRMQVYGQVAPRVFIYTQFGMNNFTANSKQYSGAFFHDAVSEFAIHPKFVSIGAGLTGWSGLARYASPAVGSILTLDAPLYQQTTNGVNDQFLRKLSVYAKGKLGKLDYRLALSKPMAIQNAVVTINGLNTVSEFSPEPAKLQSQVYLMYQFFDQEENLVPYNTGSYLGKKKIFNLGAGMIYQPQAMWHLTSSGDTSRTAMLLTNVDVFMELPLSAEKGNTFSLYTALSYFDLGPGYTRNIGVMNPDNSLIASAATFNGTGDAFPMIGTGYTCYSQFAYLFKKGLLGDGTIQPFGAIQISNFTQLNDPVFMQELGLNWLIHGGHGSKLSFMYQNRPVFKADGSGNISYSHSRGMAVLQYQIML